MYNNIIMQKRTAFIVKHQESMHECDLGSSSGRVSAGARVDSEFMPLGTEANDRATPEPAPRSRVSGSFTLTAPPQCHGCG